LALYEEPSVTARGGIGRSLRLFVDSQAAGGIVLMAATVLALIVANSPWSGAYFATLHLEFAGMSVSHWINDALMAIFFLLVGLEVKREFLAGQLSTWGDRIVPGVAALAGMAVPALIFVLLNLGTPDNLRGWAVPAATDIAFALGILALLGSRAPMSLKILLTAIAIIDDLLAVVIIALFYTESLSFVPLAASLCGIAFLFALNRAGVRALSPYLVIGCAIWLGVLLSGVHATLAGVAVAMTIPLGNQGEDASPLVRLEHLIHPWSAFLIVPIFGFANAGVSFGAMTGDDIIAPLPLGVALGLFLGKQLGIFSAIWLMIRLGLGALPAAANWLHLYAMATLCGIGFTMSLFIGGLAFGGSDQAMNALKAGVFLGSILSGAAGSLFMIVASRRPVPQSAPDRAA